MTRFPSTLEEIDHNGISVLQLAADNPACLKILISAHTALLSQTGQPFTPSVELLRTALRLSSRHCVNDSGKQKCRRCSCTQSVALLLKSGCAMDAADLTAMALEAASERARRRFVCHVAKRRLSSRHVDNSRVWVHAESRLEHPDWSTIYHHLYDPSTAEIFCRHLNPPGPYPFEGYWRPNLDYICWLIEHGLDLGTRSPYGPIVADVSSPVGVFGAHLAFSNLPYQLSRADQSLNGSTARAIDRVNAVVLPRAYTDGCHCHCSVAGCSPVVWMMKRSSLVIDTLRLFFRFCGRKHVELSYPAAIRYATFQMLGLNHTCCDVRSCIHGTQQWATRDDVHIVNEEQASLLDLHAELVHEFEEEAARIIEESSEDRSILVDFWDSYWLVRMKEELEKLDGSELTESERRAAEEIGVQWCEPTDDEEEIVEGNPFSSLTMAHWYYELDSICPEYKEPWPE